jgi:hypothetical protein
MESAERNTEPKEMKQPSSEKIHHSANLHVHGRIILKWVFKE